MHPVAVDEVLLTVTPSVGLAERGRDGDALGDLLRAADAAMYDAKRAGATVRRVRTSVTGTTLTAADLEQALARDELVVHYQPQVADADGAVTSFEALVRWNHPERGLLLPEEFLDLAERSPVIGPMTQWVVHRASSDLPALRRAAPGCSVSVNVSARILLRHRVVDELAAILRSTGTDPAQLVLEITEPAPRATPEVQGLLEQTRELGCRVSVHGFGSAQASVTALWQYPAVGEIKLDPAIVRAVGHDAQAERLCRAITSAAHGLDLRVVAEGVESSDVVPVLRRLGCDAYQGFLVGRPMPVDAVPAWVEDWQLGGSTLLR